MSICQVEALSNDVIEEDVKGALVGEEVASKLDG